MAKLEFLNCFLKERLIAAAGEIFQVVKETLCEYQAEIDRTQQENRYLRDMLENINTSEEERRGAELQTCGGSGSRSVSEEQRTAAVYINKVPPDIQPSITDDSKTSQGPRDSEPMIQVKLELCAVQQELEPQQPETVAHNQEAMSSVPEKPMDIEEKEQCNGLPMDHIPIKSELYDSQAAYSDNSCDLSAAQREQEGIDYFEVDEDDLGLRSGYRLYSSLADRPSHSQSELTDSLFYCKICNKPFKTYLWLEKHLVSHNNEERHVCGVCGKRFKQLQTLESHINNHTKERPYCCQFCGKGFSQRSHVKDHERIHTGEKPFVCPVCQRSFVQRSQLMTHIHTHSYMMKDLSDGKQQR
ncbi:zinc finger protein 226-like [Astyanax mexicanus]|uniref:Zinc finger protein 226-like n=1 Tax=Astyanax mexicanus TaxID=7994 RepID=A0A8T2KS55_ASTMX|nr:zinc finger protein 226-like [Astyanax mexicanus]